MTKVDSGKRKAFLGLGVWEQTHVDTKSCLDVQRPRLATFKGLRRLSWKELDMAKTPKRWRWQGYDVCRWGLRCLREFIEHTQQRSLNHWKRSCCLWFLVSREIGTRVVFSGVGSSSFRNGSLPKHGDPESQACFLWMLSLGCTGS